MENKDLMNAMGQIKVDYIKELRKIGRKSRPRISLACTKPRLSGGLSSWLAGSLPPSF